MRAGVIGPCGFQYKGFEEPARMRQMPLGRTRVGHRLDDVILGDQRFTKILSESADRAIMLRQFLRALAIFMKIFCRVPPRRFHDTRLSFLVFEVLSSR